MRYICLILAIFLFVGATSACGISDFCCTDQTDAEQTEVCCSEEGDSTTDNQTQSDLPCCQSCVYSAPSLLTIISPKVALEDFPVNMRIDIPVQQHSFDFHESIWQPPRNA